MVCGTLPSYQFGCIDFVMWSTLHSKLVGDKTIALYTHNLTEKTTVLLTSASPRAIKLLTLPSTKKLAHFRFLIYWLLIRQELGWVILLRAYR